ncbi:MAG: hypothetical protein LBC92_01070 [Rickettsiales bacterium]|nr:hypothetical protein [Rickettsiales bacterium]
MVDFENHIIVYLFHNRGESKNKVEKVEDNVNKLLKLYACKNQAHNRIDEMRQRIYSLADEYCRENSGIRQPSQQFSKTMVRYKGTDSDS